MYHLTALIVTVEAVSKQERVMAIARNGQSHRVAIALIFRAGTTEGTPLAMSAASLSCSVFSVSSIDPKLTG